MMTPPTDILQQEHRLIERMLRVLERVAVEAERGGNFPAPLFEKVLDFIENFSDRCHHGKEEETLFPVLEGRGIPRYGGPIGVMLEEHREGRKLVKGMRESFQRFQEGETPALREIAGSAAVFSQLLRQHIDKEDNILYPMANRVLSPDDQNDLLMKFQKVERERMGEGCHDHYELLVRTLESECGIQASEEGRFA
ncbi:MAG: hemerythrin domain-containing protein [Nitrospirae bacterium]|nr:hemerythrin domain-containing protein [Nitrospirota bacterium]